MENRKLFNVAGSKGRLFEMMQKVGKVKLNEDFMNNPEAQNTTDSGLLENAFNLLKTNQLKIKQSNTQTTGADTFLELIGSTAQGVDMVFRFKIVASEGDQDGVISVNEAELSSLMSTDINIPEGAIALQQFNAQHKAEIIDVVSEYADFSTNEPELDEEYQKAVEKIESYPFTSKPRTMVTSQQYGDEKPTNPALRVKAPELNKFVDESNVVLDNPFKANLGQHYYDKASSSTKVKAIEDAMKFYAEQGVDRNSMPPEKYMEMVKHTANLIFTGNIAAMNETKKKKKESGIYPDQIGSHFKPKSDYPVEKKKPTKVVQIDELNNNVPNMGLRDTKSNMKMAKTAANADMSKERSDIYSVPYDTQFSGFDLNDDGSQRGMNNPNISKFFDKKQHQEHLKYHQMHEEDEKLQGGLGDEATPQDFDTEQVVMGLRVEMEHSDDPTVALEIVLDHLTEDPEYYTTKEDPEASAQANASAEAEEMDGEVPTHGQDPNMSNFMGGQQPQNQEIGMSHAMDTTTATGMNPMGEPDDKEQEDILLGFKPHNVGDDLDEEFGYEEYQGNVGDRYEDSEKNTFTVSDKVKGGVGLRGTGGSKEVATSDLLKMKKLGSSVEEAYGQPDPLKIPMLPKDNKIK